MSMYRMTFIKILSTFFPSYFITGICSVSPPQCSPSRGNCLPLEESFVLFDPGEGVKKRLDGSIIGEKE